MPEEKLRTKPLTLPEVKELLESIGEEGLNQFQRRTLDYVSKFSKVDSDATESLVKGLIEKFGVEKEDAVQVANCMPSSIEELRGFLARGRKIVKTSTLKEMLGFLDKYRKNK
jgi:DNA-directed RNA polymerase subunit F